MLSDAEAQAALEAHEWIYAKTLAKNPHEYTLRREWEDDALFDEVAHHIKGNGYQYKFYGQWYTQWDAGEYFYWTDKPPHPSTVLINRKRLGGYSPEQVAEIAEKRRQRDERRKRERGSR